ncbi:MAG: hypothetical protein M5U09_26245 [Gammaproteobacteria bacterium]|nr:hypothetical protein [Gammaproteobacteria bacterium]
MNESFTVDFVLRPGSCPAGELAVPGDKSISHRAVMLGSIAEGTTVVSGLLQSEDVLATIAAMRAMGVDMDGPNDGRLEIRGAGRRGLHEPGAPRTWATRGPRCVFYAGCSPGSASPASSSATNR